MFWCHAVGSCEMCAEVFVGSPWCCVQVIDQGARLVDMALANGKMFELPGWKLISQAFPEHTVHFIGLLSDGGVHSRFNQLIGCVKGAVERGAKRIRIHILTGGL